MDPTAKNIVAALVATAHRTELLKHRALPSIGRQSRPPSRVIVVADSGDDDAAAGRTEGLVRDWQPAGIAVDFLRNRRTKGAAGAWNSGLDHLLRLCGDPGRVHVTILDDDDRWDPDHLERCLAIAESRDLDMVAAGFRRIEEGAEPRLVVPPRSLDVASFLAGNPGIQGSNLVCRLSVLLEAGLFDESLPSCTDRDLCIRIAELPGIRYGAVSEPTPSPLRLCIPAPLVHTGGEGQDRGAGPILPQAPRPHVRSPARGVPCAGRPILRMDGIGARIRKRRRRAPRLVDIGAAAFSATTDATPSVGTTAFDTTTDAASSAGTAVFGAITNDA